MRPHNSITLHRSNARRIGLIADTHVPDRQKSLNPRIIEILTGTDLILHSGDISSPEVIEQLNVIAECIAVQGNNSGDKRNFTPPLARFHLIETANYCRIGLTHGLYNQWQRMGDNLIGRSGFVSTGSMRLVRRVAPYFDNADCIIFGHGHWPFVHYSEAGTRLYINPGRAFGSRESSCAILEIGKDLRVRFYPLNNPGRFRSLTGSWLTFPL